MARHTAYKRKSSTALPIWSLGFLVGRALQRTLQPACAQLTGRLLDLGCGNSPYRDWLTRIDAYVGYDVDTFSIGAQIVGVAHHLPFGDHTFDSVLCTQVLEHVEQPWLVLDEIARILKPGGKLVLSVPQAWRLHEVPHDYFRYTRYGLQSLLQRARLELQCCTPQGGAWLLIGQTVNNHLWRNTPARGSLTWVLSRTFGTFATTLINLVCAGLDAAFPDTDDTLNYVAIAHKP